jgi:hypothetical protein
MISSRFQFSLRALLVAMAAACAVCALAAMIFHAVAELNFGGEYSGENLTYEQFVSRSDPTLFDPRGARQISYFTHRTRDGYDKWIKLAISPDDYQSLVERFSQIMKQRKFISHDGAVARPLENTESGNASVPSGWPQPEGTPPAWWSPPSGGLNLSCTHWAVHIDDGSYLGRSMGWYWLYDPKSQALWIWEWNYQHCQLK